MSAGRTAAAGIAARRLGRAALAEALTETRRDTLATFDAYRAALPGLLVPQRDTLNPPLWEIGHVGWFQGWWTTRFPARGDGARADPELQRLPPLRPGADALYDSSRVPHATRWTLPLPTVDDTLDDLARQLDATLALLADPARTADGDDGLYAFRLVLFHEDMHHEAALYMAHALGVPVADTRWRASRLPGADRRPTIRVEGGTFRAGLHGDEGGDGADGGAGFAFDNELPPRTVSLAPFEIDARVVSWREFAAFVDDRGYQRPELWSEAGRAWRAERPAREHELRQRLAATADLDTAARHLSAFEAEAWCAWAGRRLPSEFEWECAAVKGAAVKGAADGQQALQAFQAFPAFHWGEAWEWTSSPFEPYPGFVPHPYRDYSAPWFGPTRRVLRGGSHLTQPRLKHPRYRNFFAPGRTDVAAGFRSCGRPTRA